MAKLDEVLRRHRVVVCAGSGGVGKTTTAASLAVHAALAGQRAMVLTIDPAKRLANALGVRAIGGIGAAVTVGGIPEGRLSAMMLDQKGAWDDLVERHAPSAEIRDRILQNRFYQHLSQSFAGSQEYMAIEQLCELHASNAYDVIVVDTPPTRHALDFLEAPRRIADFLDKRVVKWFIRPYFSASWTTMRFVNRTAGFLFRRLEDATGISALVEVSEFFSSMSGLFEGFEPRVRRVYDLLRSPETAFVLVATPEEQVLTEAEYFFRKVQELGMSLRGVVFNRAHREFTSGRRALAKELPVLLDGLLAEPAAMAALVDNFNHYESLGRGDGLRMESFRRLLPKTIAVAEVPNLNSDVHSVAGLCALHPFLFSN
jgi:anion-transporting  ArsA/GET3 family ATPase